jgi:hypothetical protein
LEAALPARITEPAGASDLADFVSRVRMACTYYVATARTLLVAGTTNRTDLHLGRATPYGDGAADVRPLGGSYASERGHLCRRLGLTDLCGAYSSVGAGSFTGVDGLAFGSLAAADR